jgi:hypothetical protein
MKKAEAINLLKEQIKKFGAVNDSSQYLNIHYENQSHLTHFFGKDAVEIRHLENLYRYDFEVSTYNDYLEKCCSIIEIRGLYNDKKNIASDLNNLTILSILISCLTTAFIFGMWINSTFINYTNHKTEEELQKANDKIIQLESKLNQPSKK